VAKVSNYLAQVCYIVAAISTFMALVSLKLAHNFYRYPFGQPMILIGQPINFIGHPQLQTSAFSLNLAVWQFDCPSLPLSRSLPVTQSFFMGRAFWHLYLEVGDKFCLSNNWQGGRLSKKQVIQIISNLNNKNLHWLYPIRYIMVMYEIKRTEIFDIWLKNLRDLNGKGRILARIKRAELGNLGAVKKEIEV
jgi:hypothetical protein